MPSNVLIAIQARLNNTRLPGKCRLLIAGVPMLERVITAAKKSSFYINKSGRDDIKVEVCLVVPEGDPLAQEYKNHCPVVQGSESDVLSRYHQAMEIFKPDYVVRLTSDCPLIPPFVITKHIVNAISHGHDYVSNVDPAVRTSPDGWDCEVVSSKLLRWAWENAKEEYDREHVTTIIRSSPPSWASVAHVVGYLDLSHLKLSVDTEEDLFFVRTYYDILTRKINTAKDSASGMFRL